MTVATWYTIEYQLTDELGVSKMGTTQPWPQLWLHSTYENAVWEGPPLGVLIHRLLRSRALVDWWMWLHCMYVLYMNCRTEDYWVSNSKVCNLLRWIHKLGCSVCSICWKEQQWGTYILLRGTEVKQGSVQTGWQWLGQQRINKNKTNKQTTTKKTAVCAHVAGNLLITVEPLYNGHFGTSHFWVIFAVI